MRRRPALAFTFLTLSALAAACSTEDTNADTAPATLGSGVGGSKSSAGGSTSAGSAGQTSSKGGASGGAGGKGAQGGQASGGAGAGGKGTAGTGQAGQAGSMTGQAGSGSSGKAGSASGQSGAGGSGQGAGGSGQAGAGTGGSGTAGQAAGGGSAAKTCATPCATGQVCGDGTCQSSISGDPKIDMALLGNTAAFDAQVLLTQLPDMSWVPSTVYKWEDFLQALYVMHVHGVADMTYWLGDATDPPAARLKYALVNVAAFIGQAMKETIKYDACDENNWDMTNGYAMSNACGQLGQNYESYDCDMACPKNPSLSVTAVTHAKWYGAPGPLFAAPKSALIAAGVSKDGSTGHWDYSSDCYPYPATQASFVESTADAYLRPKCEVYSGQKAGGYVFDGSGAPVEGCVWWGRGVIQTTGRCNFGKLNHYLGKDHLGGKFPPPATVLYPDVSFCDDPEVVCSSKKHPELKWIAGLFYWMSSVQSYTKGTWSYLPQLKKFVDGGMTDGAFIDSVSGIVNRGCYDPPCGTGAVDGGPERAANFQKVLKTFGL
jgi:hypothetical protein